MASVSDNDKPSEVEDEPGAEERFSRGISNALKMPPAPHPKPEPGRKRGRPKVAASLSETPEYQAQLAAVRAAQGL